MYLLSDGEPGYGVVSKLSEAVSGIPGVAEVGGVVMSRTKRMQRDDL